MDDYVIVHKRQAVVPKSSALNKPGPKPKASSLPSPTPMPSRRPRAQAQAAPEAPLAEVAKPKRRERSAPVVSVAAMSSSTSSSSSIIASSDTSGLDISILGIWSQVWTALSVAILVVVVVYGAHFGYDVTMGRQNMRHATKMARSMAFVLTWVVGTILLPFLAITIVAVATNIITHGPPAVKGMLVSSLVGAVGIIVMILSKKHAGV